MEKSRMRPVPAGKSVRMSFSRQKEVLEMPNLIEIQKDSYQWFLDEGLKEVFDDRSFRLYVPARENASEEIPSIMQPSPPSTYVK